MKTLTVLTLLVIASVGCNENKATEIQRDTVIATDTVVAIKTRLNEKTGNTETLTQCFGVTKSGNRCKRKVWSDGSDNSFHCYQHKSQSK